MSCLSPMPAIQIPADNATGRKLKFLTRKDEVQLPDYVSMKRRYGDDLLLIPCGHCIDCIERRTKSWAIRCTLEAARFDHNCFLTLTYNNQCLPKGGLCKKDLIAFIKRLRNKFGAGIRYFCIGEYGSLGRAHYHGIFFNFWPDDAEVCHFDPTTQVRYYKSKSLQSLWPFGFISIGEVSFNSCAYVARYCFKKMSRELGLANVNPEFSLMSRRPGLGECYFREHMDSLMETDKIYANINNSFIFSSFRYFDKLIEKINPDKLQELKDKRIAAGSISVASELLSRNLSAIQDFFKQQKYDYARKYDRLRRRLD